jgi:hypothetical protein
VQAIYLDDEMSGYTIYGNTFTNCQAVHGDFFKDELILFLHDNFENLINLNDFAQVKILKSQNPLSTYV